MTVVSFGFYSLVVFRLLTTTTVGTTGAESVIGKIRGAISGADWFGCTNMMCSLLPAFFVVILQRV